MPDRVKVSVIMPVYGVEKYVGRAIESVLAQTMQDFEFLIVDDGSPDKSGEICDAYAAMDSRLTVIHQENGGAPAARNAAMAIAKGKYWYFMDADDWAEPDMLEELTALAVHTDAQLVVAGYFIDTYYREDAFVTQQQSAPAAVYTDARSFRKNACLLFDRNLLYTPWNKLYDGDYLRAHDLRFSDTFWDDFPFNLSVIRDIERVAVTNQKYYHFIRARAESETAKYRPDMYEKREEEHRWMVDLYRYWEIDSPQSREFLARRYIERVIGCIENVANPACSLSRRKKVREVRRIITDKKVRALLPVMRPGSIYMRLMLLPVRCQNAALAYWEGVVISAVRRKNVMLFARLKAGR